MTTVGIYAELKTLSEHINHVQERFNSFLHKLEKEIDRQAFKSKESDDLDTLCVEMNSNKRLKDTIEVFTAFGVQKIIMGKEKREKIENDIHEYINAFREWINSDEYKEYINGIGNNLIVEKMCEKMFEMVETKKSQEAILHLFGLEPDISCIIDTDRAKKIMDKCTDEFERKIREDAKESWKKRFI